MKVYRLPDAFWLALATIVPVFLQGAHRIWSKPILFLGGDHVFFMADLKQVAMHQGFWSSSITGFPFGQINGYFPTFEPLLRVVGWVIVALGFDVFTATKIFYVIGIAALGASAYICLRSLKIAPELAFVGAIAFAVSPYFNGRATSHDMLSIYVSAAFGAAIAVHVACMDRECEFFAFMRKPFFIVGLAIASTGGLYYAAFTMMMTGVALVGLSLRTQSFRALLTFAAMSGAILAAIVVIALGPHISMGLSGAPGRFPVEQFWHGLSISDSMNLLDWSEWGRKHMQNYESMRHITLVGEGYHEWPGIVLTLTILVSPFVLLAFVGRQVLDQRLHAIVCVSALMCFSLIFAGRGGIGYLLNELVTPSLRAQARLMPLLMFMSIFVTLTFIEWIWLRSVIVGRIVSAVLILGMFVTSWKVSGTLPSRQGFVESPANKELIASFKAMLAEKDRVGSQAILQLPVVKWPEVPHKPEYDFYPMRYGFLFDRADSQTKWSYGLSDRQEGFKVLSGSFAVGAADMISKARELGYDAIQLEKLAYDAKDLLTVTVSIEGALPPSCKIFDDKMRSLYDIGRTSGCKA